MSSEPTTPTPSTTPRAESQPQAQQQQQQQQQRRFPRFSELLPRIPPFWSQEVMVPVGTGDCAIRCYEYMLGLPVTCKVEHSPTSCTCSDPSSSSSSGGATDPEIVARYMSALYAKVAGSGAYPEAVVQLVVWMMHVHGDNFDAELRGQAGRRGEEGAGFSMPADIPARPPLHDLEQLRNTVLRVQLMMVDGGEAGLMPAFNARDLPARFLANMSLPISGGGMRIVSDEEDPNMGVPEEVTRQ